MIIRIQHKVGRYIITEKIKFPLITKITFNTISVHSTHFNLSFIVDYYTNFKFLNLN